MAITIDVEQSPRRPDEYRLIVNGRRTDVALLGCGGPVAAMRDALSYLAKSEVWLAGLVADVDLAS